MAEAHAWGIRRHYEDVDGRLHRTSARTRDALIRAMGGAPGGPPPTWPDELPGGSTRCVTALPGRGVAVQLYGLRSAASWGIGDFVDLAGLGAWVAGHGAGTVLVNPLDAPLPTTPRDPSPYLPSTRRFRDPIYLRPEALPGAERAGQRVERLASEARALNARRVVDHDRVWQLKQAALRVIWEQAGDEQRAGQEAFAEECGQALDDFATYQVLAASHGGDWRRWPARLRSPGSPAVARFARAHPREVAFRRWLQWACDHQLAAAGAAAALVRDLPLGFHPGGFDAWVWQDLLADGVSLGAPPDLLGPEGQDWSLPAFVPHRLAAADFTPWTTTLRSAFRHAAGLRIDHVLGLFRLLWIPRGAPPADGAYVEQPTGPLLELLARESRRAGAFVVGEDLGTVARGVRRRLRRRRILRTVVMWFEEGEPGGWPEPALAMITTHDLPTVAGLWTGADRAELGALGVRAPADWHEDVRSGLARASGLDTRAAPGEAVLAAHRRLAGAASRLVLAQVEDLCAVRQRPNVPGTSGALRANWSRALPLTLAQLREDPAANRVLATMAEHRNRVRRA